MTVSTLAAAVMAVMLAASFTATGSPDRHLLQNGERSSIAFVALNPYPQLSLTGCS